MPSIPDIPSPVDGSSMDVDPAPPAPKTAEKNPVKPSIGFIFALELVTYFILPAHLSNKWAIFFCTSFAWVAVHALDGIIIMAFNREFKTYLFSCGYDVFHSTSRSSPEDLDRNSSSKL
ncbi:hypothetical protein GCK72_018021 [Caenorhabditis remanei]|uniref:7TM GPCR serpentine receptor class x (Srx) domain-containing protein n=1 Tax=Caenorhabditis remanei TaxID=31234 RepID=A0A6A5G8T0_CAERE|nr:hypothetical protein GCK72_018021 [Caenorhabditis remanei]KAF1751467.1 hypothetical protein GCK72_018021 [Caenorhabditis remanei]